MSKAYRLIVFDWEGTIGDTLGQILHTVAVVAKRMKFGELDEQVARQNVGLGLMLAVKKLFPHLSTHQHEQLIQSVQHSLVSDPIECCLIPGARHVIQQIQQAGMELAIATNKGQLSLQRALHESGLDVFFSVTRSAGQTPAKPCPQMLQEIMDIIGVMTHQTLMIGDSVSDVEMAKQLNVDVIGFDFYHQQAANLRAAGALNVFDDYRQLANYLQLPEE